MAIIPFGDNVYQGLSSDTKPINVADGATFYETDTFTFYNRVGGIWLEKTVRNVGSDYDVYLSSGTIKARNNRTGLVKYTGTDVGAVTNTIIANFLTTGCKINYSNDLFTINTPITIPSMHFGSVAPFHFEGYIPSSVRDKATQFKVGSTFPTQRYMFEAISANATDFTSSFKIKGLYANNVTYAADGNGTTNINGTTPIIDVGFLKFESDKSGSVGQGSPCILENIVMHYLWRGIHLLGYLYWPVIWNCSVMEANIHFKGDFDLKLERSSTIGTDQHGPTVDLKGLDLRNFKSSHAGGDEIGSRGSMNNGMVFYGGYHNVSHVYLNGRKYEDSTISFKQCFSSVFDDLAIIDLHPPQGASFQGTFVFDSTDPTGNTAYSNYSTYNNQVRNIKGRHADGAIKFLNGAYRNRLEEVYTWWGANITVDDAGAGIENVIELIEGQQGAAITNSKITSTNSLVKIIDKRVGSENRGLQTSVGNGTTTAFSWNHGCFATPANYFVYPVTSDAMGSYDVTVSSSQITVTYAIPPPPSGVLKWSWYANVY